MDIPDNQKKYESDKKSDEKILEVAKRRWDLSEEAEASLRKEELLDAQFAAGEQWPAQIKSDRDQDGRPCLTVNKLPQYVHQITNDTRQNRPALNVTPVDDFADVEIAKIRQGLIRNIEYLSSADIAYDTGHTHQVERGRGYWRVYADYCDPLSFDQDIKIGAIKNPFSVRLDPFHKMPDGSDAEWGFIEENMPRDQYTKKYGESKLVSDWDSCMDSAPDWVQKDSVRVAEYFYKDYKDDTLCLVKGGQMPRAILKSELPATLPEGFEIVDERPTQVPVVKWCLINGYEILDRTDLPGSGKWIPIIPAYGVERDIDGKRIVEGVVRHARDPQRMYNYQASNEAEAIALAPKAPWIGYEGQFEGHEEQWATANRKNHAYLQVKPTTIGGQPAPFPQRNSFEPAVQAITNARMMSNEDLKATTGIYDAGLGNKSNETSGRAIERRRQQGETSNFHYADNLRRSIRHTGRIINDWIEYVYDAARAARIIGEEGEEQIVRINEMFSKNGEDKMYRMDQGKYDVTVDTGPSFATKRQEAAAAMIDFTKAMPQQAAIMSDLMVKNMDWPGAQEISKRLKKMVQAQFPGVVEEDDDSKSGKKPIPPEAQQQMAQMNQVIEQLTQKLNEQTEIVNTKKMELESKERIEFAKMNKDIEIELAKMGSQESQKLLLAEIASIKHRLDLVKIDEPIDEGNELVEADMATQGMNQPTGGVSPGLTMEQP